MHFLLTAKFFLLFKTYHFIVENTPVAQTVKNLPAMRETWVPSLGREDSPGGEHSNQLQYSGLENPMDRGA